MTDGPGTRVSDADRSATAERLEVAHGEGRLSLTEYDERLQRAYAAVVRSDLDELTADLPDVRHADLPGVREQQQAESRRKARAETYPYWRAWAATSAFLIVIWAVGSLATHEFMFFWPIFPIGFWGLGLLASTSGRGKGGEGHEAKD